MKIAKRALQRRNALPADTRETGNAIAAFVLIIPLVLFVFFALVSIVYTLHIRFLAEDAVFEGAKVASRSGGDSALAESRTRDALNAVFHDEYCANPDINSRILPDRSIEVSLYCPPQESLWPTNSIPEIKVSAYAHIE